MKTVKVFSGRKRFAIDEFTKAKGMILGLFDKYQTYIWPFVTKEIDYDLLKETIFRCRLTKK